MQDTSISWLEPVVLGLRIGAMIAVALVGIVWLVRSDATSRRAARGAVGLAVVLFVWGTTMVLLARWGVFTAGASGMAPLVPLAALLPPLFAWRLLPRFGSVTAFVDAVPQAGLVGVQVFRAAGGVFLVLWKIGEMPGEFALPVGVGDVLTGALALPVAWACARRMPGHVVALVAWNLFGMADHLMAIGLGMATSPGPLQQLALDQPNLLIGRYPLVLIPTFIVPLSLTLHGLSLWKWRRWRRAR